MAVMHDSSVRYCNVNKRCSKVNHHSLAEGTSAGTSRFANSLKHWHYAKAAAHRNRPGITAWQLDRITFKQVLQKNVMCFIVL
jgi:hypothetical protein